MLFLIASHIPSLLWSLGLDGSSSAERFWDGCFRPVPGPVSHRISQKFSWSVWKFIFSHELWGSLWMAWERLRSGAFKAKQQGYRFGNANPTLEIMEINLHLVVFQHRCWGARSKRLKEGSSSQPITVRRKRGALIQQNLIGCYDLVLQTSSLGGWSLASIIFQPESSWRRSTLLKPSWTCPKLQFNPSKTWILSWLRICLSLSLMFQNAV